MGKAQAPERVSVQRAAKTRCRSSSPLAARQLRMPLAQSAEHVKVKTREVLEVLILLEPILLASAEGELATVQVRGILGTGRC